MALTTTIQTADGAYDLAITRVGGSLPDRQITLLERVVTRWGDSGDGWGDPVLPSTTTVTLYDPTEEIVDLIDGFGRRELQLQITGPDSYDWRGWYTAEPIQRPFIDSRQGERPTYDLLFYDGLTDIKTISEAPIVVPDIFQEVADLLPYDANLAVYTDMEWDTKYAGTLGTDDFYDTTNAGNSLVLGGFLEPRDLPEDTEGFTTTRIIPIDRLSAGGGDLADEVEDLAEAVEFFCRATDTRLMITPSIGRAVFVPRHRVGNTLTYSTYFTEETPPSGGDIFPTVDRKTGSTDIPERVADLTPADVLSPTYVPIADAGLTEIEFPKDYSVFSDYWDTQGGSPFGPLRSGGRWNRIRLQQDDAGVVSDPYPSQWDIKSDYFETTARVILDVDIAQLFYPDTPNDLAVDPTPSLTITMEWVDRASTVQYSTSENFDLTTVSLPIQERITLDVQGEGRLEVNYTTALVAGENVGADLVHTARLAVPQPDAGGSTGLFKIVDTFVLSDADNVLVGPTASRGEPIGVDPDPYLSQYLDLASDSTPTVVAGPTETYRDTFWNIEGVNPHLFRARQRAAAQAASVQTLRATALGVFPPEYAVEVDGKPGVKYVPGEGRKIELAPGRARTTLYDIELPNSPPS